MLSALSVVKGQLALWAMAAMLAVVSALASAHPTFPGDAWALQELVRLRTGWLDDAAIAVSTLGQGGIGWGLAVPWIPLAVLAAALAMRLWADAVFLAASSFAPLVNLGLKDLVERPRPDVELWLVVEFGYGFPSGHTVFAASFLGALVWLAGRPGALGGRRAASRTVQAFLLAVIVAVGFSRVYLGVHWPSDVIGGFLFGGLYLALLIAIRRGMEARLTDGARVDSAGGVVD